MVRHVKPFLLLGIRADDVAADDDFDWSKPSSARLILVNGPESSWAEGHFKPVIRRMPSLRRNGE